jgi:hypothetical protein
MLDSDGIVLLLEDANQHECHERQREAAEDEFFPPFFCFRICH